MELKKNYVCSLKKETDFREISKNFLLQYARDGQPIQVNFRDLVNHLTFQDRATHLIHSYPAKLLPHIPYFFLHNSLFAKKGFKVLDPFSGSGTVLLEAKLSGMHPFGSDANPLARLISKVKTDNFDIKLLNEIKRTLFDTLEIGVEFSDNFPNVINLDYWFTSNVKIQLNSILIAIKTIKNKKYRDFFLLCFSNCIKKLSLADPRVSVPVRIKPNHYPFGHPLRLKNEKKLDQLKTINARKKFFEIVEINIKRYENSRRLNSCRKVGKIISEDARKLQLNDESIDLIITSPPYAGAQKYIRASSLNLGWTELVGTKGLKFLDSQNIGRENYVKSEYINLANSGIEDADFILKKIHEINPLRAHIASNYLLEMKVALSESIRVLKKDKYMILVAANNQVCGFEFRTQDYLKQICESFGMKVVCRLIDDIKSYGLMTKRNKTASIITCEWVLILQKRNDRN